MNRIKIKFIASFTSYVAFSFTFFVKDFKISELENSVESRIIVRNNDNNNSKKIMYEEYILKSKKRGDL